MLQKIETSLKNAKETAIVMSKAQGYAAIILSMGKYYIEDEMPFIRNGEKLIGHYQKGKAVK